MPRDNTWLLVENKFRNSAGVLLPYLLHVDFDVCTIKSGEKSTLHPILLLIIKFLGTIAKSPFIKEGCPLRRGATVVNLNFEDIKKDFLPPIIPEGLYVLYWRIYLGKTNHTVLGIKLNIEVRSTGVMQLSMLNMG